MAPRTETQGRIRRLLVLTAAAAALAVGPTACGYAVAADRIPADATQQGDARYAAATTAQRTPDTGAAAEDTRQQDTEDADGAAGSDTQRGRGDRESQEPTTTESAAPEAAEQQPAAEENNGLDVLARDCSNSELPPHDGFQKGDRCVSTAFGEVGDADENPSLLITKSPDEIGANTEFTLTVSTRNLIRDRFLGAAAGGYYLESSVLSDGIQRGHFHTACRKLANTDGAPDPAPAPEFFLATQDNKGGKGESSVDVPVPGLKEKGLYQCAVWAGDGSHRIPMMERANQTPAFDAVRITVV